MKTLKENRETKILDFLNGLNLEIDFDYIDFEQINDFDDLENELQENNLLEVEIIYYYKAMKYLSENDASLSESMEIASDFGFETKNINSELLATLHASQELRKDFYNCESEIIDFFDNL